MTALKASLYESVQKWWTPSIEKVHDLEKSTDGFIFKSGICSIPHDEKRNKGGEDAFVATPTLLVVADGVGGWAAKGVDSGLFSK